MHFVEWFASRGEHYEQNMLIIDRHLGKLSQTSFPPSQVGRPRQYQSTAAESERELHKSQVAEPYISNITRYDDTIAVLPSRASMASNQERPVTLNDSNDSVSAGDVSEYIDDPSYVYWS